MEIVKYKHTSLLMFYNVMISATRTTRASCILQRATTPSVCRRYSFIQASGFTLPPVGEQSNDDCVSRFYIRMSIWTIFYLFGKHYNDIEDDEGKHWWWWYTFCSGWIFCSGWMGGCTRSMWLNLRLRLGLGLRWGKKKTHFDLVFYLRCQNQLFGPGLKSRCQKSNIWLGFNLRCQKETNLTWF